jgi:hypothetical protein
VVARAVSPALPILDDFCHGLLAEALQEFLSTSDPSQYTFELPDHIVAAMVELEAALPETD